MYLIVTIVTYLLIVKGLGVLETSGEKEQSNKTDSTETLENGAAGKKKYRFGAPYSNDVQEQSKSEAADDLSNKIKNDLSYTM